jgi:uncharacterized protein YndB with AHSA1/START domain
MKGESETVEREIFIGAAPETVFKFLIDGGLMAHWLGTHQRLDPRPGGSFHVEVSPGNVARGVYTEIVPFHRVALTWGWDTQEPTLAMLRPGASLVEFELKPRDGGTLVRLRHSRLPNGLRWIHGERWTVYLGQLAAHLTTKAQL